MPLSKHIPQSFFDCPFISIDWREKENHKKYNKKKSKEYINDLWLREVWVEGVSFLRFKIDFDFLEKDRLNFPRPLEGKLWSEDNTYIFMEVVAIFWKTFLYLACDSTALKYYKSKKKKKKHVYMFWKPFYFTKSWSIL